MQINYISKHKQIILLFTAPLITMFCIEALQGNFIHTPVGIFMNFLICALPYWALFLTLNSIKIALPCSTLFLLLIGIVNHYVIIFRNASLQPWDFSAIQTAINVLPAIKFSIDWSIIVSVVWFVFILIISFAFSYAKRKRPNIILISLLCGIVVLFTWFHFSPNDNRDDFWDTVTASKKNGFLLTFITNFQILNNPQPDGYNVATLSSACNTEQTQEILSEKPNIIVIMNEAFSDPIKQYGIEINRDPLDFIHNLDGVAKGDIIVSVFGGGTCNTEYDFLTGNSSFMLRKGSYPMQQFVTSKSPSIASTLKAQGYDTTAIHPYFKNGWNRNRAYPLLGFDNFISLEDFEDPEILRKFVSDKCAYDKIIQVTENASSPQFIFCVTMQNHLGYDIDYANFEEKITFPMSEALPQTRQYLSLLDVTDDAIEYLINYYKNSSTPTYILFFGDHQPALEEKYYTTYKNGNVFERHTVPYFLWYNHGALNAEDLTVSANFLAPFLLKTVGLQRTPYDNFLLELMDSLPVISSNGIMAKEGTVYDIADNHPYKEILDTYNNLQYNQVFDSNKLWHLFTP